MYSSGRGSNVDEPSPDGLESDLESLDESFSDIEPSLSALVPDSEGLPPSGILLATHPSSSPTTQSGDRFYKLLKRIEFIKTISFRK